MVIGAGRDRNRPLEPRKSKKEIDSLMAKFLFACNIPFVISESEYFRDFVHALNPEYVIPNRKMIAGPLLEKCFNDHKSAIKKDDVSDGILLLDGWKNSAANVKNVVAMVRLNNNGKFFFLEAWNFSSISETGENLLEIVNQCKELALQHYNIHIYAAMTDNVSSMVLMGKLANIWHTTCNSHSGNLLCKTIANSDQQFVSKVSNLLKEFKAPKLENLLMS